MGKEACYLVWGGGTRVYCCPYLKGQGTYISHRNKTRTKREEKMRRILLDLCKAKLKLTIVQKIRLQSTWYIFSFFFVRDTNFFINLCFLFKLKINIRT